MASPTVSTVEHSFRVLVFHIADKLTPQNCRSLRFIYELNTESLQPEVTGLDIMKELMANEHLHYMRPGTLENCLTEINRQDLLNLVRKYKKSDEFKAAQKQESKKIGRKWVKAKVSDDQKSKASDDQKGKADDQKGKASEDQKGKGSEDQKGKGSEDQKGKASEDQKGKASEDQKGEEKMSSHNLPFILMHTAQTVGQTKYFLEAMTQEVEQQHKRKEIVAAIDEIKKDFERLGRSLNKAISLMTEPQSAEISEILSPAYDEETKVSQSEPRPIPLPKPRSRMSLSATQPNLSSLARIQSCDDDTQDHPSSSATSGVSQIQALAKSRTISGRQNTYSGDSGYSGSSCHSAMLIRSRINPWKLHVAIDPEMDETEEPDHTYDVPKNILQNLSLENSECVADPHIYANT